MRRSMCVFSGGWRFSHLHVFSFEFHIVFYGTRQLDVEWESGDKSDRQGENKNFTHAFTKHTHTQLHSTSKKNVYSSTVFAQQQKRVQILNVHVNFEWWWSPFGTSIHIGRFVFHLLFESNEIEKKNYSATAYVNTTSQNYPQIFSDFFSINSNTGPNSLNSILSDFW